MFPQGIFFDCQQKENGGFAGSQNIKQNEFNKYREYDF